MSRWRCVRRACDLQRPICDAEALISAQSIISGQRCTPLSAPEFERWLKHRDFSLEVRPSEPGPL